MQGFNNIQDSILLITTMERTLRMFTWYIMCLMGFFFFFFKYRMHQSTIRLKDTLIKFLSDIHVTEKY